MKQFKIVAIVAITTISLMSFTTFMNAPVVSFAIKTGRISWANEIHDFGEITRGKPVSIEFAFTNTGDDPILISDVETSCGCTAADYSKEPYN